MAIYDGARIEASGPRTFTAQSDPAYWNAVGPFGGWIAAVFLRALAIETGSGDPLSLSINFAAAMKPGSFVVRLRELRANRSTTFWSAELVQEQEGVEGLCAFATIVLAQRRESPSFVEIVAPEIVAPETLARFTPPMPFPFLSRFDQRFVADGYFPKIVDGQMLAWVRMLDAGTMEYETLAAVCDAGLPQIFVRLKRPVPVSTVTLNVFFHAKRDELVAVGDDFLLTGSRMRIAGNGFFDTVTSVWSRAGALLATTEQVVWFRVP